MNEIKIFNNPQFGEIRTATTENGEPLFCLSDICDSLKLSNNRKVKSQLDDDVTLSYPIIDSLGRDQIATFVTEAGMYTVILRSDSPLAKPMQKWVTSEVLPSIRKHGAFITENKAEEMLNDPDVMIQLLTVLKTERAEKRVIESNLSLAQRQLEHQAPVVQYAAKILTSKTGHTATTIAYQLGMSGIELNRLLVLANFIRKTGDEYSLTARNQGKGYEVCNTIPYENRKMGTIETTMQLTYTEAGRMKIHELFQRAKLVGAIREVKGRYFTNTDWKSLQKNN